ncbi:BnaC04g26360D [Brassica napus]|uniref:BnaC04g26360D protein n=1 Tax=Brassica napus TaxID=3708 RepID=A0A078FJR2_BRANA|nr:BnaC04g26360D [Brassica napus]
MSQQKGLIYSFVAKGTVVLAEHTPYSGNFSTIAVQCLQKLPKNSSKVYLLLRCPHLQFPCRKQWFRVSCDDDFFADRFSIAYNLDREFGPLLKEHMQFCMSHPEEMSKLSKLKAHINDVKGIMMDNIDKVLDRGERIELLVDKTENLQFQADSFQRQGRQLRRKMWIQSLQMKLMVGGAVLSFILIVWVVACGGFKCSS